MKKIFALVFILNTVIVAYAAVDKQGKDRKMINSMLDKFHIAASKADGEEYFSYLTEDSVYLGTAEEERWSKKAFMKYAEPYFSKGRGWTYKPFDRFVMFAGDGKTAWFDEKLSNKHYGILRGAGVVRKDAGKWRIVHYNMTIVVPNPIFKKVAEIIKKNKQGNAKALSAD